VKLFLLISQIIYALGLLPWLFIWGMSVMVFDAGVYLGNTLFFIAISAYPIAVIGCSITAWLLRLRRRRTAIFVNLLPVLWILGIGLLLVFS